MTTKQFDITKTLETLSEITRALSAMTETGASAFAMGLVGRRFFARVAGEIVRVTVVEDTGDARRPYRLVRSDNGRALRRTRARAALHDTAGPWGVRQRVPPPPLRLAST